MKRFINLCVYSLFALLPSLAQPAGGFGGVQKQAKIETSQVWKDVNYAGDGKAYHTCDIYLPKQQKDSYPVVIHIYGSAWFNNNGKGMADIGTIVRSLLDAGYAVVCPNHRSSADAQWPAQLHDIRAVVRFVRGEAQKYHFDPSFIATSGFSSGGHLSSTMATTNGMKTATVGSVTLDLEGSGLQQLLETLKFSKLRCEKLSDPELLVQKLSYIMQTVRDDPGKCTSDCSAKAYDLLMYLHYLLDMTSENADSQKLAQISPVIRYIDMNYRSEMTLEQLSGLIQISPQYLCRLFKDCYKMRPFEYLARKRIQQAKLMLVEDGYSVNEVAQLVGYNDCSYFCSVFKKYESISPAEFRTLNCGEEK